MVGLLVGWFTPSRPLDPAKSHVSFGLQAQPAGGRGARFPVERVVWGLAGQLGSGWLEAGGAVELVPDGVGGEGVGGPGDGGGEGVLGVGESGGVEDESAVVAAAPGHAHVDPGPAGAGLDDADGVVGGDALAAVAGNGPSQFDEAGDVVGGELDGATVEISDRERAVAADGQDGPGMPVTHGRAGVADERSVAAGGDLVADQRLSAVGQVDSWAGAPGMAAALDL